MSIVLPTSIGARAAYTKGRLSEFTDALRASLGEGEVEYALGDHGCVYATGSGGRGEMHESSDLDAFIVYRNVPDHPRLRGMLVQAAIVRASRRCGLPAPSRDGEYLVPHDAASLLEQLGAPADDMQNALTARMLLLLESRPLIGEKVYAEIIRDVMERYWETSRSHERDFLPFMLANDIIRYWRIILLNHESKVYRKKKERLDEGRPEALVEEEIRHRRKYSSYKMRFARCLTCFSALAFMLARTKGTGNLALADAIEMVGRTPLERLAGITELCSDVEPRVQSLIELYAGFLERSTAGETAILARLGSDEQFGAQLSAESSDFTREMLELLLALRGQKNEALFRHMVI